MSNPLVAEDHQYGELRAAVNLLLVETAEAAGFTAGLANPADVVTNTAAWQALLTSGGYVHFGPYDYDIRSLVAMTALLSAPVVITGVPGKTRLLFSNATVPANACLNARSGSLYASGIHFENFGLPGIATNGKYLVYTSLMEEDVDRIVIENCRMTNWECGFAASTANPTYDKIMKRVILKNNVVRNRGGLCRAQAARWNYAQISGNDIDCGLAGIRGGFGGIVWGYVANPGNGQRPDMLGHLDIHDNDVRNVRPLSNPGSVGNYGIEVNAKSASIHDNFVEKVLQHYGTARSEVIVTGDGETTVFTGSLTYLPLLDSLTVTGTGVVADDADHAWYRPGVQLIQGTGLLDQLSAVAFTANTTASSAVLTGVVDTHALYVGASVTGTGIPANAYVTAIDHTADTVTLSLAASATGTAVALTGHDYACWIDYNTKQFMLCFATPPGVGVQITAAYKESGASVGNIEPIYGKAGRLSIQGNRVQHCAGNQAMICTKGGGSLGWMGDNGDLTPQSRGYFLNFDGGYSGGPGSSYASIISDNFILNTIYTGVFANSTGVWIQNDYVNICDNYFEGLTQRFAKTNPSAARGRVLRIANNILNNFRAPELMAHGSDWDGFVVDGLTINNWIPNGGAAALNGFTIGNTVATVDPSNADQNAPDCNLKGFHLKGVRILNDFTPGCTLSLLKVTSAAGTFTEAKVSDFECAMPWKFEDKRGAGTGGKRVFLDYSTANNTGKQVVLAGGGNSATAAIYDDGGHI